MAVLDEAETVGVAALTAPPAVQEGTVQAAVAVEALEEGNPQPVMVQAEPVHQSNRILEAARQERRRAAVMQLLLL